MKYTFINKSELENKCIVPFTENVLRRSKIKTNNPVIIEDWDLDRVYLTIDGQDYDIRMWDIWETKKQLNFRWTLFTWLNGETSGTDLNEGYTRFKFEDIKKFEG